MTELKKLIRNSNRSQRNVAMAVGIDPSLLCRMLAGKRPINPDLESRIIASLLDKEDRLSLIDEVIAIVDKMNLSPGEATVIIRDLTRYCLVSGEKPTEALATKFRYLN